MSTRIIIQSEVNFREKLIQLVVFSAAMALLESAVVVYLRALYYPEGFTVALKLIDGRILLTEIAREAATIVMLGGIAVLSGRTFVQRFAYFLFCFAIWDIFYYIWLKVFIDWPESVFTWDILFLIPVTWLGPVLAPLLCSLTMILLACSLLWIQQNNHDMRLRSIDWLLLVSGSCFILYTFLVDYATIILKNGWLAELDRLMENEEFIRITTSYVPSSYNWSIFCTGLACIFLALGILWKREYKAGLTYSVSDKFTMF